MEKFKTEESAKARAVEKALEEYFPGLKVLFYHTGGIKYSFKTLPGSRLDFYDMYPDLTKEQADAAILMDVEKVIRTIIPHFVTLSYFRDGNKHYVPVAHLSEVYGED